MISSPPSKINNPHDKAFKSAMSDIRVAQAFFEQYLPDKLKNLIDLSVLTLQSSSFIDEELRGTETDLLYRTQFCFKKGQVGYLYLLTEQQTKPDRWLPLRLLRYMCSALEQFRRQNPGENELPLIVPLIFYTGKGLYTFSTDCFKLFGAHHDLARDLIMGPYSLVELNKIPDDEIYSHKWTGLLELLMKHAQQRDMLVLFKEAVERFIQPLSCESNTDNYILNMLKYTLDQGEVTDLNAFFERVRQDLPKEVEQNVMTIAEQLRQQGLQQGLQQGEAQFFVEQLKYRFGDIDSNDLAKIQKADTETLLKWGRRIFEAKNVKDIFN